MVVVVVAVVVAVVAVVAVVVVVVVIVVMVMVMVMVMVVVVAIIVAKAVAIAAGAAAAVAAGTAVRVAELASYTIQHTRYSSTALHPTPHTSYTLHLATRPYPRISYAGKHLLLPLTGWHGQEPYLFQTCRAASVRKLWETGAGALNACVLYAFMHMHACICWHVLACLHACACMHVLACICLHTCA